MKHLSLALLAALTLGTSLTPSLAHADGWVDMGYVIQAETLDVGTNFPNDEEKAIVSYTATAAYARTAYPGAEAHAFGYCYKEFVWQGANTPVYAGVYETAQVRGYVSTTSKNGPTNAASKATVTLISITKTGTQNYNTGGGGSVGIPVPGGQTKIRRTMGLDAQVSDYLAEANATGSLGLP